jgi:sugar phosphate isomerase/epimerase
MSGKKTVFSLFTGMLPRLPLETVAGLARESGFDGLELGVGYPNLSYETAESRAEEIRRELLEQGLSVVAISCGGGPYLSEPEKVRRALSIAQRLGTRLVRVLPPWYDGSDYRTLFDRSREQLEGIVELCRAEDCRAMLETHFGNLIPSPSLALRLMEGLDPRFVGILHDPANQIVEGREHPGISVGLMGPYLAHVHVKNATWGWNERDWQGNPIERQWGWSFTGLRQGMVDWGAVVKHLLQAGYEGAFSFEDLSLREDRERLAELAGFKEFFPPDSGGI